MTGRRETTAKLGTDRSLALVSSPRERVNFVLLDSIFALLTSDFVQCHEDFSRRGR